MSLNRFFYSFSSFLKSTVLRRSVMAFAVACLCHLNSFAQIFPVAVTTNLRAPYSLNLSDYASPAYDRMQVNLNMTDLSKVNYPVLLRLVIRGQGVTLITQPGQEIGPLYLTGGQIVTLTGSEVNQLFNPEKLQFSGITYQQYKQNTALPEGIYQFHFEVVDYELGVTLSNLNAGFSTAWLVLNDPPLINTPENNATIVPMPQQNIFFQWTPRHTGSPNSAFTTVYDVQLVEIYPSDRNPNDAMLTSPLIFEKTLYNTSYNYSIIDPYLMPDKWYAFRVKARDMNGLDLFKNQGFSEVYRFYYGQACTVPANLKVDVLTETSVVAYWDNQGSYEFTELEYRPASSKRWSSVTVYLNRTEITGMNPGEQYFFRLRGKCPNNYSEYTDEFMYAPVTANTGGGGRGDCDLPLPEEIKATATDLKTVSIVWNTSAGFDAYTFRYRPLGRSYFDEVNTQTASTVIQNLDFNQIYEGQIVYHCAATNTWVDGGFIIFKITVPPVVLNPGGGTGSCFPPLDITHNINKDLEVTISWPKDKEATGYRVYWRENVTATSWDSVTVSSPQAVLKNLKKDTEYEYQIKSICKGGDLSIASKSGYFNVSENYVDGGNCPIPKLLPYTPISSEEVKLNWESDTLHTSYVLEYRERGSKFWVASKSILPYQLVEHLTLGTTYEYHVYAFCGLKASDYSVVDTFSTVADPPKPFVCGTSPGVNSITNRTPIASLEVGDKFTAADFQMEVLVLTTGAPYNGEAMSKIPYLMNSTFRFGMQNVQINDQGQMYDGKIYMKGINLSVLDPKMAAVIQNMMDQVDQGFTSLDQFLTQVNALQDSINDYISRAEGGNNTGKVVTGNVAATQTLNIKVSNASQISGSGNNGNCQLTVRGDDGSTQTISIQAPATIADNSGNIYAIDLSCNATKVAEKITLTQTPADFNNLSSKATVTYVDYSSKQKFGFSAWNPVYANNPAEWAIRYQLLGSAYRVPAKAIEPATVDYVKATISVTDATIDKSKVIFVTGKGVKFTSKSLGGNDYEINVVGGPDADAQELYALYPTGTDQYISFGKLLIASYKHKKRTLVLVPVNGASVNAQSIKTKLNAIYNKYCVEWEVTTDANFTDMSWDDEGNGLAVEGSGRFTVLTDEMLALNKAYKEARTILPTNIYLFVLNKSETAGVRGDMPRAKQFGYLFTENYSEADIAKTAAHEVGHGLFLLRHIFDGYGMTEGSLSSNLMDYPAGEELAKLQWDVMHDPGIVLGVFERDEDVMLAGLKWFTPNWRVFSVSGTSTVGSSKSPVPQGTVPGIFKNGILYEATFSAAGNFIGYLNSSGKSIPDFEEHMLEDNNIVYLYQDNGVCGTDRYYKTTYKYAIDHKSNLVFIGDNNIIYQKIIPCESADSEPKNAPEIINKTGSQADYEAAIHAINTQLVNPTVNQFTGDEFKLKQVLLITLSDETSIANNQNYFDTYDTGTDKVLIWITYNKTTKKAVIRDARYPSFGADTEEAQSELDRILDDIKKEPFHLGYILLYEMSDLLSQGIEHLKIPKHVYDCHDPKYDPLYAKVLGYLSIEKLSTNLLPFEVVKQYYPDFAKMADEKYDQVKFALQCGLWNGLVDVIKSVPDLVNLATTPYSPSGRDKISQQFNSFKELEVKDEAGNIICNKEDYGCKVWEMVKSGCGEMVENECVTAHTIGSIAGPIIVACFGDVPALAGELGTISATLRTMIKIINWCDKAGDIFTYLGRFGKLSLKLVKKGTGGLSVNLEINGFRLMRQDGDKIFVKQLVDGKIVEVPKTRAELDKVTKESLEEVLEFMSKFYKRLDDLKLDDLKRRVGELDEITKIEFINDFCDATDGALRTLNEKPGLLEFWKNNAARFKNKVYPNAGHKNWDVAKQEIISKGDPTEMKILDAIEKAPLPDKKKQKVMAGAYSSELGGEVEIAYNTNGFDVTTLEPELQQNLEYFKLIWQDAQDGGKLYEKLYTNVPAEKIQNANIPGMHAEVLAVNEVIVKLKKAGKFHSMADLSKIKVLVKGNFSGLINMCRCPHCFNILEGVIMIGNQ